MTRQKDKTQAKGLLSHLTTALLFTWWDRPRRNQPRTDPTLGTSVATLPLFPQPYPLRGT